MLFLLRHSVDKHNTAQLSSTCQKLRRIGLPILFQSLHLRHVIVDATQSVRDELTDEAEPCPWPFLEVDKMGIAYETSVQSKIQSSRCCQRIAPLIRSVLRSPLQLSLVLTHLNERSLDVSHVYRMHNKCEPYVPLVLEAIIGMSPNLLTIKNVHHKILCFPKTVDAILSSQSLGAVEVFTSPIDRSSVHEARRTDQTLPTSPMFRYHVNSQMVPFSSITVEANFPEIADPNIRILTLSLMAGLRDLEYVMRARCLLPDLQALQLFNLHNSDLPKFTSLLDSFLAVNPTLVCVRVDDLDIILELAHMQSPSKSWPSVEGNRHTRIRSSSWHRPTNAQLGQPLVCEHLSIYTKREREMKEVLLLFNDLLPYIPTLKSLTLNFGYYVGQSSPDRLSNLLYNVSSAGFLFSIRVVILLNISKINDIAHALSALSELKRLEVHYMDTDSAFRRDLVLAVAHLIPSLQIVSFGLGYETSYLYEVHIERKVGGKVDIYFRQDIIMQNSPIVALV